MPELGPEKKPSLTNLLNGLNLAAQAHLPSSLAPDGRTAQEVANDIASNRCKLIDIGLTAPIADIQSLTSTIEADESLNSELAPISLASKGIKEGLGALHHNFGDQFPLERKAIAQILIRAGELYGVKLTEADAVGQERPQPELEAKTPAEEAIPELWDLERIGSELGLDEFMIPQELTIPLLWQGLSWDGTNPNTLNSMINRVTLYVSNQGIPTPRLQRIPDRLRAYVMAGYNLGFIRHSEEQDIHRIRKQQLAAAMTNVVLRHQNGVPISEQAEASELYNHLVEQALLEDADLTMPAIIPGYRFIQQERKGMATLNFDGDSLVTEPIEEDDKLQARPEPAVEEEEAEIEVIAPKEDFVPRSRQLKLVSGLEEIDEVKDLSKLFDRKYWKQNNDKIRKGIGAIYEHDFNRKLNTRNVRLAKAVSSIAGQTTIGSIMELYKDRSKSKLRRSIPYGLLAAINNIRKIREQDGYITNTTTVADVQDFLDIHTTEIHPETLATVAFLLHQNREPLLSSIFLRPEDTPKEVGVIELEAQDSFLKIEPDLVTRHSIGGHA